MFQQILGVLRWSIDLGKKYSMTKLSCLYQHLCSPCERHLNDVYMIFRYLQKNLSKNPGKIALDTAFVHTDEKLFKILGVLLLRCSRVSYDKEVGTTG